MTWRPRYSWRTLIVFVLLVTAGMGLWWHWEPAWVVRDQFKLASDDSFSRLKFLMDGDRFIGRELLLVGNNGEAPQDISTAKLITPERLHYITCGESTARITSRSPDGAREVKAGYWWLDPPPNLAYVEIRDDDTSDYVDAPLAVLTHDRRVWSFAGFSRDGEHVLAGTRDGDLWTWRRRRPEWWWGVFWLWEFWLTVVFAALLVWSVWRDRRTLAGVPDQA